MTNTQKCREAADEIYKRTVNDDGKMLPLELAYIIERVCFPEPAKVDGDDSKRLDWLEENSTYVGGGNGGTFTFKTPADTECFRAAIDAAINKSQ